MSIVRHLINHAAREGIKATDKYLNSYEFKRDSQKVYKAVEKGAKDTYGGLNRVKAEISKTIGIEKCTRCGRQIKAHDSVSADRKGSYCSSCKPLNRNRF